MPRTDDDTDIATRDGARAVLHRAGVSWGLIQYRHVVLLTRRQLRRKRVRATVGDR